MYLLHFKALYFLALYHDGISFENANNLAPKKAALLFSKVLAHLIIDDPTYEQKDLLLNKNRLL